MTPRAFPGWPYPLGATWDGSGYRVFGPHDPRRGLRFNPHKLLIDPYAKAITGPIDCSDAWRLILDTSSAVCPQIPAAQSSTVYKLPARTLALLAHSAPAT